MQQGLPLIFNVLGIFLQIIGFILVVTAVKKLVFSKGIFDAGGPIDPDTGIGANNIQGAPKIKQNRIGIGFVIAGLCFTLIAVFV